MYQDAGSSRERGTFFETYGFDSDEQFWINEIATHHELLADLWSQGIVDQSLALGWSGAMFNWKLIGPVLLQAREVFGSDDLLTGFEALAGGSGRTLTPPISAHMAARIACCGRRSGLVRLTCAGYD